MRIPCLGQALAEDYARVDGYHTFYSWSRLRSKVIPVLLFFVKHL